jgi:hypothetical protein
MPHRLGRSQERLRVRMDLWDIAFYGVAIVGLAMALASWSYSSWAASATAGQADPTLSHKILWLGLLLFCVGVAAVSEPLWEQGVWALLALVIAIQIIRTRAPAGPSPADNADASTKRQPPP